MKQIRQLFLGILFLLPLMMSAQTIITGNVKDDLGEMLPGVSVMISGTTSGTATDFDGNYTIEAKQGDVLLFSFVGMTTATRTVGKENVINVSLVSQENTLDEVVLIGYGTTTIKDATGSVAAITEKDFNQGNIPTPAGLITGRVAGVDVTTDGSPGGGSAIRIRGGSSLGASNDPLIVIDGLPISNSNAGGSRSILASINPNDIESFSILKDASATAIYGSRASNGVIIISTKKGRDSFQVDINLQMGYQTLVEKVDIFGADEFRDLIGKRIDGGQSGISLDQLGTSNTNWQDEIYEEKFTSDASISLRGGLFGGAIPTRLSLGYTNQPGLRKTSEFERGTSSLSMNPSLLDDHLKINFNVNLSEEHNRFADGVEGAALIFDPTQPVYDATSPFGGYFEYHTNGEPNNAPRNPVASLMQVKNVSNVKRLYGNFEVNYKFHFLPEMSAVVNLGYDNSDGRGSYNRSKESINGYRSGNNQPFLGTQSSYTSNRTNRLLDAYLNYDKDFDNFGLEVTAGYSYQKFEAKDYNSGNIVDPDHESDVNTHPDVVLIGYFARTNLSFNDKYLLTLSYRRDGTSRFSEDNRWGNFPAAAFAWKISEEDFLNDSNTLSTLKLRLGWGITGQQDIAASYAYLGRYIVHNSNAQYIFGNTPIAPGIPQSVFEDLKWEETTTYNVGFDYGFFNDLLTGSLEVYLKESNDLLASVPVADGSNFSNVGWQNIGKFTSKGIEFSIGADVINKENLRWTLNYNISANKTEIEELAGDRDIEIGGIAGGTGSRIQVHKEGFSPYSFNVFKQLYDEAGAPVEGAYVDINQDGIVNTADRYIYKKPAADILMGFQSNFNYKNFDFAFNLRASIGNYNYNNVNSNRAQYNNLQATTALGNIPTSVLASNFNETASVLISDYYMENASFLKMDNLTFGYNFNDMKGSVSNIRLWTGVQNVFTITNYTGLDPEVFGGIDNSIYPRPRTFLLGANIKF